MSGKPVVIGTLRKLAKALDVSVESLLDGFQESPPAPKRAQIVITTTFDFADFTEADVQSFVEMLKSRLPAKGEIIVKDVKPGSVIITLEMDEADIVELAKYLIIREVKPITRIKRKYYKNPNKQPMNAITSAQLPDSEFLPGDLRGKKVP